MCELSLREEIFFQYPPYDVFGSLVYRKAIKVIFRGVIFHDMTNDGPEMRKDFQAKYFSDERFLDKEFSDERFSDEKFSGARDFRYSLIELLVIMLTKAAVVVNVCSKPVL